MTRKAIVRKLNQLYSGTKGKDTYQCINSAILNFWNNIQDETIVGIGYSSLYLKNFVYSNSVIAATPFDSFSSYKSLKTVINSDEHLLDCELNLIDCVVKTDMLPFLNNSIDRILIIHALEYCDHINQLLREIWRILVPGGSLLIIVPNKFNILSYLEKDTFNNCQSFSIKQLYNLLYDHMFMPINTSSALFGIPNLYKVFSPLTTILENSINKSLLPFGGVLLIEATKLMYASNKYCFKQKKIKPLFPTRKLTSPYNRRS